MHWRGRRRLRGCSSATRQHTRSSAIPSSEGFLASPTTSGRNMPWCECGRLVWRGRLPSRFRLLAKAVGCECLPRCGSTSWSSWMPVGAASTSCAARFCVPSFAENMTSASTVHGIHERARTGGSRTWSLALPIDAAEEEGCLCVPWFGRPPSILETCSEHE